MYLDTGEPVGSRSISRRGVSLSPASIRNVMSDLSALGLLDAPHASAGRIPTHAGLRMFVDSLLQIGEPSEADKRAIESRLVASHGGERRIDSVLQEASEILSGLAGGAGLVSTPTDDTPIRHVEFVRISAEQALAILVDERGEVENRLLNLPPGLPVSTLIEAGNFLSAHMRGKTLTEAIEAVREQARSRKAELDEAARKLVEQGLAQWSGEDPGRGRSLIVRGRANLLDDSGDLDRVRSLFGELERTENLLQVLDNAHGGAGVRLFIGAENPLFSLSGSATIVSPYMNAQRRIFGALGVIGPTRLNYARVIPIVDYTAQVVGRLIGDPGRRARDGAD